MLPNISPMPYWMTHAVNRPKLMPLTLLSSVFDIMTKATMAMQSTKPS